MTSILKNTEIYMQLILIPITKKSPFEFYQRTPTNDVNFTEQTTNKLLETKFSIVSMAINSSGLTLKNISQNYCERE